MEQRGLKHEAISEKIIGVFFDVYNELGYGFLESVYEKSMLVALKAAGLLAECQVPIPVWFRGVQVAGFFADILVEGKVMLELKAARAIDKAHEAQLLNYLKATEIEIGLLLNFGQRAEFRRLLFDNERKKIRENPCKSVAKSFSL
jgi:GxxExxY protein